MNRIVGKSIRAVMQWVLLSLVLLCFMGCGRDAEDSLETLSLEESRTEENRTGDDHTKEDVDRSADTNPSADAEMEQEKADSIFVYVCGAVKLPGVYELEINARVYEAIAMAGGLREDAAEMHVNQAQVLSDGEQIYIPTKEEVQQGNTAAFPEGNLNAEGTDSGKVNLNTASLEELKTLSGIGDTRAESIIEYRETNGGFQTIEDLMKVDGIKEGVFEKIKDSITVG